MIYSKRRQKAIDDRVGEIFSARPMLVKKKKLPRPPASNTSTKLRLPQIEKMPRKPKRHCQLTKPHPFTFSPFARSVARVANAYKVKSQIQNSKFHRKSSPNSSGDKLGYHSLADKSEPSESSEEEEFEGIVQADFAFFDPKPDDFHGVKVLLQTYLDDKQWDLSGFVDLILGQTTVGTIVKIEEDEDDTPYSVVTALNLRRYKDHICIKELKDFLLQVCKERDLLDNLKLVFGEQAQTVGLLVSQRVVNLPPQLLPPLYDALFDEVSWATEDERSSGSHFALTIIYWSLESMSIRMLDRKKQQIIVVRRLSYMLSRKMKFFISSVRGPLGSHCELSSLHLMS